MGKLLLLKFPGDREAGFRWRFDKERSTGLDLVTVKEIGWTIPPKRKSFFFRRQPSIMTFSVMPEAPGRADLAFEYARLWGGRLQVMTKVVRVVIRPAAVAAR